MITEQQKLLALANLKIGKSPKEVADQLSISYPAALKLRKELATAEERDLIHELFNMDKATLGMLLESVEQNLEPASEILDAIPELSGSVTKLSEGINGLSVLEADLQRAASALSSQILAMAITSNNASTIVMLAEALSELQKSFFAKGTNVQIANVSREDFQKYLVD